MRVFVGLLLTGAFIELAQLASGWRQGELVDLLADFVGVVMGTGLWMGTRRLKR